MTALEAIRTFAYSTGMGNYQHMLRDDMLRIFYVDASSLQAEKNI
ncbi:hypothetical protein [Nostoc sp. 'Peltigera membranacea cyanobiont' 232]|nr:hypothetical protein [Nostoc sp. 'Peltigera membranacea cyanobiont' 232]